MAAYYNENEPFAAQWLRNLIKAGHIADGEVDERSIVEVEAKDLVGYAQCHFFAGIGVWSHALRNAGWPDDRKVWTGSCPCQPFSVAGTKKGFADERHLWPVWFKLIEQCRPDVVFGEQVANPDALIWFDAVQSDLEGQGYSVGPSDLCAAGVGAPHLRQRLYWVADTKSYGRREERAQLGRLASGDREKGRSSRPVSGGDAGRAADALDEHGRRVLVQPRGSHETGLAVVGSSKADIAGGAGPVNGFWREAEFIWCRDEKYRPVKSGTSPLVDGAPQRVGRLHAYGNAIVAPVAETFVRAYLETSS